MSNMMHPPLLDEWPILALRWFYEGGNDRSYGHSDVLLICNPPEFRGSRPALGTGDVSHLQEALTNVFRHSQAKEASVTLVQKENSEERRTRM